MWEIEQKYSRADFDDLRRRLAALGAGPPTIHDEADHYFNAPDRDFARSGEAFRLRRVGDKNYFTFKGPRQPGAVKVRPELEFEVQGGDEAANLHRELLRQLGYRFVTIVRKRRESYALAREGFEVHVCLDDAGPVGRFAEVEVVAPQEQAERARDALTRLADELGLSEVEPRSYLAMLLAHQAESAKSSPIIVTTAADLRREVAEARRRRLSVGFVPTMGALHEGHQSLIRASRARDDFVVVSIFVNPTQFGPNEDLTRYPRPLADDVELCGDRGADLIYHPSPEEIYPPGYRTFVEVTALQDHLEGASRPGHFRGVATVVLKLFLQVSPDRAYFGQKDAQQVAVIRRMVRDLDVPVEVVIRPTVREPDGLALSSRNRYLDAVQRGESVALHRALRAAESLYQGGERDPAALRAAMEREISEAAGAVLDYAAVVDADTFEPAASPGRPVLLALAVRFGGTRLIDNLLLG